MNDFAIGLGHFLLGGLFVWGGIDHVRRFEAVKAMLAARRWPRPGAALAAASAFELLAGLGMILDILRPWAALGLAGFTLVASLLLLDFWRSAGPQREPMRAAFAVNVALISGLILAFGESL